MKPVEVSWNPALTTGQDGKRYAISGSVWSRCLLILLLMSCRCTWLLRKVSTKKLKTKKVGRCRGQKVQVIQLAFVKVSGHALARVSDGDEAVSTLTHERLRNGIERYIDYHVFIDT